MLQNRILRAMLGDLIFGPILAIHVILDHLGQFGSIWVIVGHVGQKAEPPNKALEILLVSFLGHPLCNRNLVKA